MATPSNTSYDTFVSIWRAAKRLYIKRHPPGWPFTTLAHTSNASIIKRGDTIASTTVTTTAIDTSPATSPPVLDGSWHIGNSTLPNDWMCVILENDKLGSAVSNYACLPQSDFATWFQGSVKPKPSVALIVGLAVAGAWLAATLLLIAAIVVWTRCQKHQLLNLEKAEMAFKDN
jgi:hypothetical protein